MNKSVWTHNTASDESGGYVTGSTVGEKRGMDVNLLNQSQQTSYGVSEVVSNNAYVRASPVYNLIPANFRTFTSSGGSGTATNREFKASTGTTIFGYGAIQSFRSIGMEYGQTALCRFSARFPGSVPLTWRGVGMISITDEMSFGMNGTEFGVWYRHGGESEVRTIRITTGASGSENATVTINGTAYTVALTNILTIRNKRIYNGKINQAEIEPVGLSIANEGNKNLVIQLRANCTVAGTTNFQDIGTNLITEVEIAGTTVTEDGRLLTTITVAPGDSKIIDLTIFNIRVPPTLRLTVAARQLSGGSASSVTATVIWEEDI